MEPFTVTSNINRRREDVYDYLSDIANHAEFSDHYLVDWHLTRENPVGVGAGASFRSKMPRNRFAWGDMVIADMQPPYRILLHGRGGKYNRIRTLAVYTLQPVSGGTRVQYTYETEARMPSDKLMEILGGRAWQRRKAHRALRRLRSILEDGTERGTRAGYAEE
ncbi:MAG TPA: SRPBCC family protein [Solirubrobacteraceae bacterium]|nr:SRPBCC family protein [Solirubrobacteraceae bacterium]